MEHFPETEIIFRPYERHLEIELYGSPDVNVKGNYDFDENVLHLEYDAYIAVSAGVSRVYKARIPFETKSAVIDSVTVINNFKKDSYDGDNFVNLV